MPREWSRQYQFVEVVARCECGWTTKSGAFPEDHDAHHVNRLALKHSQRTKHVVTVSVVKRYGH
jgi:hypothetical protein